MDRLDLESFLEEHGGEILSFCRYLTKNREEAEDLCQDTFVQGFELQERLEDAAHAKKFFLSVAVQLWKNRKRMYARRRRIVDERLCPAERVESEAAEENLPEEAAIRREEQELVRRCVDSLPEKKRLLVLLYYTGGLKETEIAEVLQLPLGTVKSRLHQSRAALAALLSRQL